MRDKIVTEAINSYEPQNSELFRYWHVESLLNQCADLLERCASLQVRQNDVEDKKSETALRRALLKADIELQQKRESSGWQDRELRALDASSNAAIAAEEAALNARNRQVPGSAQYFQADTDLQRATADARARAATQSPLRQDAIDSHSYAQDREDAITQWDNEIYPPEGTAFDDELRTLKASILADYKDAYDRANVAHSGLKAIFDYKDNLPYGPVDPDVTPTRMDELLLWVRRTIRHLTGFQQLDQGFTIVVDLGKQVDLQEMARQLTCEGETTLEFETPSAIAQTYHFVRFRGASLIVDCSDPVGLMGTMHLPMRGSVWFADGVEGPPLNQEQLPPMHFGRVQGFAAARPHEVCGSVSLINASPFSSNDMCRLRLRCPPAVGALRLDRMLVEFYLVGHPPIGGRA